MEFNNENLEKYFDTIKEIISKCDFLAIDTELTGLSKDRTNFYDTQEMRYKSIKENSMEYAVTQLGICTFNYKSSDQSFEYCPMNFLLKQHSHSESGNFLINYSTIEFLNKSKFNFNDVFQKGIFFINHKEYEERKNLIEKNRLNSLSQLDTDINIFDFSHLNDLIKECEDFLWKDDIEEMKPKPISSKHDRYLILNELWKKIGCINGKWISVGLDKNLFVIRKSHDVYADKKAYINEKFDKEQKSLENLLKVADIVKSIIDSKVPIVAHNSFLDILHLVNKFIEPLPESYRLFKITISKLFPRIYDTKFISHDDAFKHLKASGLQSLYEVTNDKLVNPVMKPLNEEFDFSNENSYHTAHYDAMVTGKIFISLFTEFNRSTEDFWTKFIAGTSNNVSKFLNRIKVVDSEFNYFNFNLEALEKSVRKNIFQITFPTIWRRQDIILYLSSFLQKTYRDIDQNFGMRWLNSTSLSFKLPISDLDKLSIPHENKELGVSIVSFYEYFRVEDPDSVELDEDGFQKVKKRKCCKSKNK